MKVLVCGGRRFSAMKAAFSYLDTLHAKHKFTALIQGGAGGADQIAKKWAKTKPEIERYECKAKWDDLSHPYAVILERPDGSKYDSKAGTRRNARMLEWKPDLVVAFPGGHGTANMKKLAREAGVTVVEINSLPELSVYAKKTTPRVASA